MARSAQTRTNDQFQLETRTSPVRCDRRVMIDPLLAATGTGTRRACREERARVMSKLNEESVGRTSGLQARKEDAASTLATSDTSEAPAARNGIEYEAAVERTPTLTGTTKKTSEVFGEIVWLMSQSQAHQGFSIRDLEWFAMTPILLRQFRLFHTNDRPIGVLLWAHATEEVAAKLARGNAKLRPQDWIGHRSNAPANGATSIGTAEAHPPQPTEATTQVWVVDVIAPFGGAVAMIEDLKAQVHPDRDVHYVRDGQQGPETRVM
ncbi:MAG: toxin-activating lysine-acyltransferase [Hyphomicrobiaceae bacterium]